MKREEGSSPISGLLSFRIQWLLLAVVGFLLLSARVHSAEIVSDEGVYRLAVGEVVADDLYVFAGEIYIDGKVEGDLIAAGGNIELRGEVSGDINAAGGAINILGVVGDDARLAGGSIAVSGAIGDDLLVAGGGSLPGPVQNPFVTQNQSISPGFDLDVTGAVAGDALVVGGYGTIGGSVVGDLSVFMNSVEMSGSVGGDAHIRAETLVIEQSTRIGGELTYSTASEMAIPDAVAGRVVYDAPEPLTPGDQDSVAIDFLGWFLRTVMILLGLVLLAWVISHLSPNIVTRPATALADRPTAAVIYGLVVVALAIPFTAALVFIAVLFWGWFPGGIAMFSFGFGLLSLGWILSPLITGHWLGHLLVRATDQSLEELPATLLGVVVIVLTARLVGLIPCAGELALRIIYLLSFALAVGGLLLLARGEDEAPDAAPLSVDRGHDSLG